MGNGDGIGLRRTRLTLSRRDFLRLMGVAAAAGGLGVAGCSIPHTSYPPADSSGIQRQNPVSATGSIRAASYDVADKTVAIVRDQDRVEAVRRAVALVGGLEQVVKTVRPVVIKPNLTISATSGSGNVTDSRVLGAVLDLCKEAGSTYPVVCDGSGGGDSAQIARTAGYDGVITGTATFVDLNKGPQVLVQLPDALGLHEYAVSEIPFEAGALISVAVLKTHNEAMVSLCSKNLMGLPSRASYGTQGGRPRELLHQVGVHQVIADIVAIFRPDFCLIDGSVGLEGDSPMNGSPVEMNVIIAGRNPVSVDAVGAAIMGFNPQEIGHLSMMAQEGLGTIDLGQIEVIGNSIDEVKKGFRRS